MVNPRFSGGDEAAPQDLDEQLVLRSRENQAHLRDSACHESREVLMVDLVRSSCVHTPTPKVSASRRGALSARFWTVCRSLARNALEP
jgi:hypothetical protein